MNHPGPGALKRRRISHSCASFWVVFALLPDIASALSPVPPLGLPPSVSATPAVAPPGTARVLRVAGLWHDSCPPVGATALEPGTTGVNVLTLRMQEPQTLVACAQVLTVFSVEVSYTPAESGTRHVVAVHADGRYLGEGRLVTATVAQPRAQHNLTGAWFEQATNGSGLALYHSQDTSDVLVGSWYLFDNSGTPRWYTIQGGRWTSANLFSGMLLASQAQPGGCPVQPACPVAAQSSNVVAAVTIEVHDASTLTISAFPVGATLTTSLPPLFGSTLRRLSF